MIHPDTLARIREGTYWVTARDRSPIGDSLTIKRADESYRPPEPTAASQGVIGERASTSPRAQMSRKGLA